MTSNSRQLLAFVTFICAWSGVAGVALSLKVNPLAIFAVWAVGFVWGVGYIAAGKNQADLLLKRWLQMMFATAIVGGGIALFLS